MLLVHTPTPIQDVSDFISMLIYFQDNYYDDDNYLKPIATWVHSRRYQLWSIAENRE